MLFYTIVVIPEVTFAFTRTQHNITKIEQKEVGQEHNLKL